MCLKQGLENIPDVIWLQDANSTAKIKLIGVEDTLG